MEKKNELPGLLFGIHDFKIDFILLSGFFFAICINRSAIVSRSLILPHFLSLYATLKSSIN